MMTKKHYIKAAEIVKHVPGEYRLIVAEAFVTLFLGDNPRFNKNRFMEACGLSPQ